MTCMRVHGMHRLLMLACIVGSTTGVVTAAAQSVTGQAYGVYVSTPLAGEVRSALAVLPAFSATDGAMASNADDALSVPNAVSSDFLNSVTTGASGTAEAGAQSVASVARVNILGGLITARGIIANATSSRTERGAASNVNGSTFDGLMVAGVPVTEGDATVAPNTRMDLPNVGYVVLNEQTVTGDGAMSSGVTVNMIHVVLQQPIVGLLGRITGYRQVGEIIVGSATSAVGS